MNTLVIGDVHGHLDRLEALLEQEGIIKDDKRVNREVEVVQIGDLGHFGATGTPTGDLLCYKHAADWFDVLLWGNHDRAVVAPSSSFGGYRYPGEDIEAIMKKLVAARKLKFAYACHDTLLTHAGLHANWQHADHPRGMNPDDPYDVADYFNATKNEGDHWITGIGALRGGREEHGGILWRDIKEPLYEGMAQVFGHSADRHHLVRQFNTGYCIDIGGRGGRKDPDAECLAGLWLPERRIVRVDLGEQL